MVVISLVSLTLMRGRCQVRPRSRAHGGLKFTNEVQHPEKVLPWDDDTNRSPLKSGVRFPVYERPAPRSGKLMQVWIARHRRSLES